MNFEVGQTYIYNFSKEQYFTSTDILHEKLVRVVSVKSDSTSIEVRVIGDDNPNSFFWNVSKCALESIVEKKLEEFLEMLG